MDCKCGGEATTSIRIVSMPFYVRQWVEGADRPIQIYTVNCPACTRHELLRWRYVGDEKWHTERHATQRTGDLF